MTKLSIILASSLLISLPAFSEDVPVPLKMDYPNGQVELGKCLAEKKSAEEKLEQQQKQFEITQANIQGQMIMLQALAPSCFERIVEGQKQKPPPQK